MRVIFSRKGFDSKYGGAPSPIVRGRPISLPIPTQHRSQTTYDDLGLGELVEQVTKGRIGGRHLCHHDPMFHAERCAFGQTGGAQGHLARQGVSGGDVFLFFGLFSDEAGQEKHHRIFGYLKVEEVIELGARPRIKRLPGFPKRHPHTIGEWNRHNTLYLGEGRTARHAADRLRLTAKNENTSVWRVPSWLRKSNLSRHDREDRWLDGNRLRTASPGQEFVAHIDGVPAARTWLKGIIEEIRR